MQSERPSGAQFELRHGARSAVVTEVGAGLRVFDDVLLGFAEHEMASAGRGQVLLPWPNRIGEGGEYEWEGETHRLPVTDRGTNSANHGLVRWVNWQCVEEDDARVALEYVLHPQPGYPFTLHLRVEYALGDDGLTVTTSAENVGARACPFGAGHHPYIACDVDALFGDEKLDECRRWDGSYEVGGVTVWADERWPYVQLFTGDLPAIGRRGFAVEPMTCPPQAFRTGESLIRLEPGERFSGTWGIRA